MKIKNLKVNLGVKHKMAALAVLPMLSVHALSADTGVVPLSEILDDLAKAAGLQLIYVSDDVDGVDSVPVVEKDLSPNDQLKTVLDSVGLSADFINERTVRIYKGSGIHLAKTSMNDQEQIEKVAEPVAQSSNRSIEEVVVVAQRREQSLQSVPISVTALTAESMDAVGINDVESLASAVPGLIISRQRNSATPFLRGVGSPSAVIGQEASVATYLDGVYMPSAQGTLFSFNNIQQVEVLKGPQGTLFGRNATGGVVHIITKDPDFEKTGKAALGYSNFDTWEGSLYASGALTESIAADLAFVVRKQGDGWGKNVNTGEDIHIRDDLAVRTKWLISPGVNTDVRVMLDYSQLKDNVGLNSNFMPGALGLDGVTGNTGFYNSATLPADTSETSQGGGAIKIDHNFGYAQFMSLTSYRETHSDNTYDQERTPNQIVAVTFDESVKTFAQEFHLLSSQDSALDWILGAYYLYDESGYSPQRIAGAAAGSLPYIDLYSDQETESLALFGQVTKEVSANTRLTLGLRYTRDERRLDARREAGGVGLLASFKDSATFNKATWRVSLDHDFSENVFGYISYNRGFRSGVFNLASPADAPVKPEVLDAYEIGLKTDWFDNRLRLNGTFFYYDYSEIQTNESFTGGQRLVNAAEAEIYGVEMDFAGILTERFGVSGGFTYLDSEYKKFPSAPFFLPSPTGGNTNFSGDASGNDMVQAPRLTATLSFDYHLSIASGEYGAVLAIMYKDSLYWDPQNRLKEPERWLVNSSLSWKSHSSSWGIQVWGRNLLDEKYYTWIVTNTTGDGGAPAEPRTYGVTATYEW